MTHDGRERHQDGQPGDIQAMEAAGEPAENSAGLVCYPEGSAQWIPPVQAHSGWWPRGALNQRGVGPTGALGVDGRQAWPVSRLNGFLQPLSLSSPVSLGQVYPGAFGEGVGQEEDVQSPPKGPRNVSQEGEKERGDPSLSERGRQGPLTNE